MKKNIFFMMLDIKAGRAPVAAPHSAVGKIPCMISLGN